MDISINSGKYAKKEDLKVVVDTLTEMAKTIDEDQELIDRKIKLLFKMMTECIGDLIEDYQSFNDSWMEKILNEKSRSVYKKAAEKLRKDEEDKMIKKMNSLVAEFNTKI